MVTRRAPATPASTVQVIRPVLDERPAAGPGTAPFAPRLTGKSRLRPGGRRRSPPGDAWPAHLDWAAGPCHHARVERMKDQERAARGAADPPPHFHGSSSSTPAPPCREPSRPPSTRATKPASSARPRPATASITSVWPCFLAL